MSDYGGPYVAGPNAGKLDAKGRHTAGPGSAGAKAGQNAASQNAAMLDPNGKTVGTLSAPGLTPLFPAAPRADRPLLMAIAIMAMLAALAGVGARLAWSVASGWIADLDSSISIQVDSADGLTGPETAARAAQLLREIPGVASAEALASDDLSALLASELNMTHIPEEIPLPGLIGVEIITAVAHGATGSGANGSGANGSGNEPLGRPLTLSTGPMGAGDAAEGVSLAVPGSTPGPDVGITVMDRSAVLSTVKAALADAGFSAMIDDHTAFRVPLQRRSGTVRTLGGALFVAALGACFLVTGYAVRANMVMRRDVVEVLHIFGARDHFIANAVMRRFLVLGGKAGLMASGLSGLCVVFLAVGTGIGEQAMHDFAPRFTPRWLDGVIILVTPALAAGLTAVSARRAALGFLKEVYA